MIEAPMRLRSQLLAALALLAAVLGPTTAALAAPTDSYYELWLSRVADNVYRDQSTGLAVVTSGCLSLALGENVVYTDTSSQLFFQDGETCSVSGIYQPSIRLTRAGQDLYRDLGGRGYLRTRYCYVYTYGEDVLVLSDRVVFLDSGEDCQLRPF